MPYADPEKQRAAKAEWIRKKRAQDPKYREAENIARAQRTKEDPDATRKEAERRKANPEQYRERMRVGAKKWRERNPELARERRRAADTKARKKVKATIQGVAEHAAAGAVELS
jgi:hypothetical protein